nr:hypothetical protein KPHV_58900 [Kitasatospora purpeofusca]
MVEITPSAVGRTIVGTVDGAGSPQGAPVAGGDDSSRQGLYLSTDFAKVLQNGREPGEWRASHRGVSQSAGLFRPEG